MPKSEVINEEFKAIKTALQALEPLKPEQRKFAIDMIVARLGLSVSTEKQTGNGEALNAGSGAGTTGQPLNPRQFLRSKNPTTDLERYVCLAYYLTHYKNTPKFTSRDITSLNDDAGGQNFSNAAATATNAMRQSKLLGGAGKGKKRITTRGEDLVEALPDRQKVAAIIKSKSGKRAGRKPKK